MSSIALRPWTAGAFAVGVTLASVAMISGVSCRTPPPACPRGDVCVKLDDVSPLRLTPEGMLGCPMYIAWGGDAGVVASPALMSFAPAAEGTLDLEATRKSHTGGGSDSCCYHWYKSCPTTP